MSARSVSSGNSGAGYSGMSHLSSGTINGRGSFMQNSAVERQRKYTDTDSLERYVWEKNVYVQLYLSEGAAREWSTVAFVIVF